MIVKIKKKEKGFSQISNDLLNDNRLSLRSRGLVAMLLSKPDDWQVSIEVLVRDCKEGRDAIQGCFKELHQYGYATLRAYKGAGGNFAGKQWVIHEEPVSDGQPEKRLIRSSADNLKNGPSEKRTVGKTGCEEQTKTLTNKDFNKQRGGENENVSPSPTTENGFSSLEPFSFLNNEQASGAGPRPSDKPAAVEFHTDLVKQIGQFYKAYPAQWTDGVKQGPGSRYTNDELLSMLDDYCSHCFANRNTFATFSQHHGNFIRWIKNQKQFERRQPADLNRPANPNAGLKVYQ